MMKAIKSKNYRLKKGMIRKMNQEIIIVSGNEGKIKETQEILSQYRIIPIKKLKEIEELEIDIDVEEDQPTFERNAIKKA